MAASASRPEPGSGATERAKPDRLDIVWLKKRRDFVQTQRGRAARTPAFILTMRRRETNETTRRARFGFTVTKRIGNAVRRNRIKRRFREAVRQIAPIYARAGHDYVLIARNRALDFGFAELADDIRNALERVHAKQNEPKAARPG